MKTLVFALSLIFLISCKKEKDEHVNVIRDCTGTYLRWDKKDYHVCNPEKVAMVPDGGNIVATFKRIKKCNGSAADDIVCMMVHENEGWVEVEKIR